MKQFLKFGAIAIFSFSLFLSSCKKDTPAEPNEEELITTVKLKFTPQGGGDVLNFEWEDLDGNPNTAPEVDQIILDKSKKYDVSIEVKNRSVNPEADITEEISAEKESHRFYYIPAQGSSIAISGFDKDGNGVSVGLNSLWETSATLSTGKIKIILRHYAGTPPNKLENDPADSPKSASDIEVDFDTQVK